MTEQQPAQGGVMPAVVASIETTGPQQAVDDPTPGLHRVSLWRPHISRRDWLRTAFYAGLIGVVGLLAGLVWYLVAPLQSVTVTSDGTVTTTNTAAVQNFGPDAAFIMIGLVAGLVLGAFNILKSVKINGISILDWAGIVTPGGVTLRASGDGKHAK